MNQQTRMMFWLVYLLEVLVCVCLCLALAVAAHAAEPTPVEVVNPVTISPPPPPVAPSEVTVSGVTDTEATISWSPVAYATQYSVWVDGQRWTGSTSPGVTIRGLQPSMTYTVYITAANESGESGPSASVSFTTLPPVPTAPEKPVVTKVTDTTATVQWHPLPPDQHIQAYRVYVDGKAVADVQPQEGMQVAELTNLKPGTHTVAVSGLNANKEGPQSPAVSFTVQAVPAPTGLQMVNHSYDAVWLQWDKVTGAERYEIYVGEQLTGTTDQTSYTLTGLQPDQEYQVSLVALLPDGNRSQPATLQVKTLPAPEAITLSGLKERIFPYVNDVIPALVVVFAVGAAFTIARMARMPFSWRV